MEVKYFVIKAESLLFTPFFFLPVPAVPQALPHGVVACAAQGPPLT